MDRRTFIASAAALLATRAFAAPGASASPETVRSLNAMAAITERGAGGTVHVLFAPWCPHSKNLYEMTRPLVGQANLRWIPFSGGLPEGREATERLLSVPGPASLSRAFERLARASVREHAPLSDAQDAVFVSLVRSLLVRDGGRGVTTPTVAYEFGSGRARIAPGGLDGVDLANALALAT